MFLLHGDLKNLKLKISINEVFPNVNKVENVCVFTHIFNLIDNVEYVVYAMYFRIYNKTF
jgi:hypothetical protein